MSVSAKYSCQTVVEQGEVKLTITYWYAEEQNYQGESEMADSRADSDSQREVSKARETSAFCKAQESQA